MRSKAEGVAGCSLPGGLSAERMSRFVWVLFGLLAAGETSAGGSSTLLCFLICGAISADSPSSSRSEFTIRSLRLSCAGQRWGWRGLTLWVAWFSVGDPELPACNERRLVCNAGALDCNEGRQVCASDCLDDVACVREGAGVPGVGDEGAEKGAGVPGVGEGEAGETGIGEDAGAGVVGSGAEEGLRVVGGGGTIAVVGVVGGGAADWVVVGCSGAVDSVVVIGAAADGWYSRGGCSPYTAVNTAFTVCFGHKRMIFLTSCRDLVQIISER